MTSASRAATLLLLVTLGTGPAVAVQPDEVLADPKLETRARGLSAELRCLVCQNQSIDDSAAPLARDLRIVVRDRLRAGDSDAAVKRYLVARYGDFILLKPPFDAQTLLLWSTPLLVLALGCGTIVLGRRTPREPGPATADLTPAEQARLAILVQEPRGHGHSADGA